MENFLTAIATRITQISAVLTLLAVGSAQAALVDRGGGMLYDDVLNITWLQDANYAKTSGYDADGLMNWTAADTWAANLVYGGFDDWRLASTNPVGANWNYYNSTNGLTDVGYNITSPNSELSYMYYVNLGLKGALSWNGMYQPDFGIFGDGTYGGQNDVGLVQNLQSYAYWSGTTFAANPDGPWLFFTDYGYQAYGYQSQNFEHYAWAVRSGDVANQGGGGNDVPEPGSIMLAGLGFGALALQRRRKSSRARAA